MTAVAAIVVERRPMKTTTVTTPSVVRVAIAIAAALFPAVGMWRAQSALRAPLGVDQPGKLHLDVCSI